MKTMTINEAMVLSKAIRGRLGELSSLRQASATLETTTYNGEKKTVEPMYDCKALDKRCTELENFLLQVESKIKQSNAIITISVDADVNELLAPIV